MTDIQIYITVGIVVVVLIYGVYYFVSKYLEKESLRVQRIKETLELYGELSENGLFMSYQYEGHLYDVILIKVPKHAKFQFNSRTIWQKKIGQKYYFTDQTIFSKMPNKKIVVIYPNEGPFMYHYDENELRFIKPNDLVWDMHIIAKKDLDTTLKEGFK